MRTQHLMMAHIYRTRAGARAMATRLEPLDYERRTDIEPAPSPWLIWGPLVVIVAGLVVIAGLFG